MTRHVAVSASRLATASARYSSTVELSYGDRTVNARGLIAIMLGAFAGSAVVVPATGEDALEAVQALVDVLATADWTSTD